MTEAENIIPQIEQTAAELGKVKDQISERFLGQPWVVEQCLIALLSGGHALLVGVPGLGKTLLVETIGTVMGLATNRVQFTPDLMPADILGSEVLDERGDGTRAFRFIEGPIFCQMLMADEINRASPRTQSALLQAMQERSVAVAGQNRPLGPPFHVLATQNPIEQEGTYPLPEAQLDRFLLKINVPYPDVETERNIVVATTGSSTGESMEVMSPDDLVAAQALVRMMPVGDAVVSAILNLVRSLRPEDPQATESVRQNVAWGPGPRAAQALMLAARARALIEGRFAPSISDVAALAPSALLHRMALTYAAQAQGIALEDIIGDVVNSSMAIAAE